jgi:hypothetical protein
MEEIKSIDYESNSVSYVIKLFKTQDGFNVMSFKEDKRISPTYSVSNIAASDFGLYYASKAYEALIELAKSDIDDGLIIKT